MVEPRLRRAVGHQRGRACRVACTAGDVDDGAYAVLAAHLPIDAQGEPQRADQVHLDGEGVEKGSPLVVVSGTRRALDLADQLRYVLDVRRRHGATGIVD